MKSIFVLTTTIIAGLLIPSCTFFEKEIKLEEETKLQIPPEDYLKKYNITTNYNFNPNFRLVFNIKPDSLRKDYYFSPDITFNKSYVLDLVEKNIQSKSLKIDGFYISMAIRSKDKGIVVLSSPVRGLIDTSNETLNLSDLKNIEYSQGELGISVTKGGKKINLKEHNDFLKSTIYLGASSNNFILIEFGIEYDPCGDTFKTISQRGQICNKCGPLSIQFVNRNFFGGIPLERNTICD